MALTYEQFKKAKESGLSTEQIVQFEKRRTKESQVGQKIQTQTEQPSGVLGVTKAVGGFLGELAKDITKPTVSSIVSPIQLAKTAKNYYGDEDVQKRRFEAMRGIDPDKQAKHTDDLYKALKTAETEEEKASIIKLMQEDLNKYVKGIQEKPIKEEVDTSVTLPFYGEIEAPKTAKEVAGRALETAALGVGGTAKVGVTTGKSLFKRALTGPGSKIGTTYGAGSALSENKSLGETAIQAGIGGILGGATDLALIGGGKGLQKLGEKLQKPATKTAQQTKEEIAGRVITGKTKDRAVGVKALESIDTKNVKTFKDLEDKFSSKITELSKKVDKKLDKDTSVQKLKDIVTKAKSISGKEVKTNYVKTALEHLQEVYKKTGDNVGVQNIKDTIKKATTTGLTKKEINNIARSYGVEFGKKAFSKTGEPLTSVNSKLYETVRKGLKEKAREAAAGLGTKEMDKTMSAIYRTRDLVSKNKEEVNKLQQKIQERGLGEKFGRRVFDTLNLLTVGGLKGFIERGMGRGTGAKTLNYLELENNLAKNLKLLEKANKSKTTSQLEKTLNEITRKVGVGISKTGEVISKIPGIAEEAPRKSVQSLMEAARTKMPIGMTIKDVSKEGFSKAGVPQKLTEEAKKYKSADEFVKAQTPTYHGSSVGPLKRFSNKKGGAYFTDEYTDATGFAGTPDNVYEGYLNFKKPLVIDAKGAKWDELNTKWGKSTQEIVSNAQKEGYDGVTFKNIVDNIGDTADWGGQSTIHYAYKPEDAFVNESQLTDIWNKAKETPTIKKPITKKEVNEEVLLKPTKKYFISEKEVEAINQEELPLKDLYHVTPLKNLESIREKGLTTKGIQQNFEGEARANYFTNDFEVVKGMQKKLPGESVVLRYKTPGQVFERGGPMMDEIEANSYFYKKDIPINQLEILTKDGWKPLISKKTTSLTGYHVARNPEAIKTIEEKGFSLNKFGSESGTKDLGDPKGVYFFSNKEIIKSLEGWSDIATPKNTLKRTLNLEKPYIIESKDKYFNEIIKPATKTTAKDFDQFRSTTKAGDSDKISEYMLKNKYDGILDEQGLLSFDEPQIIVLDLNKIKKEEFPYKETGSLTTKLLKKLEGRTTVNKQFISDLTNSPDLKQTEKDLIRAALKGEDSKVNVTKFANKVKAELLPLKRQALKDTRYENISLPDELRGNVANYSEHVYQSPIKTSAGETHFSGYPESKKYFGHTRVEDLVDTIKNTNEVSRLNKMFTSPKHRREILQQTGNEPGGTRRVLEIQSDLYQKGGLDDTMKVGDWRHAKGYKESIDKKGEASNKEFAPIRKQEVEKLAQYNDPTAHFRMVREEIAQAAKDKKTKVQFPTGETAMKIEGLGDNTNWSFVDDMKYTQKLTDSDLKVGKEISQGYQRQGGREYETGRWIITDVLGDGKFKAIPKSEIDKIGSLDRLLKLRSIDGSPMPIDRMKETFDISGKVDTSHPIYKFYEKEMGKYLKSKYNAKEVIDDQGVSWYEVDIKPDMKGPIEAFGIGAIPLATQINQDKK